MVADNDRTETSPPPRTMRRMGRPLRWANAAAIAGLAGLIARQPAAAVLFGVAAVPLWLALFAASRGAVLPLRGSAIAANVASLLACAILLGFVALYVVTQGMEPQRPVLGALVFAPILALNVFNLRALVGPSPPASARRD
jgi:hypothetical protein